MYKYVRNGKGWIMYKYAWNGKVWLCINMLGMGRVDYVLICWGGEGWINA